MTDIKITEAVRARLAELENEHGQLTPATVVRDAKKKDSPLHGLFDWDVKSAAMKFWLYQARTIIHSVRLVSSSTETVTINAPHYVRDPSLPANAQGYVAVARLQRDPVQARESLRLEFDRAAGALTRARSIAEVLGLTAEVDAMIAQLVGLRARVEEKGEHGQAA